MQLYALDEENSLVFAPLATKHRDYFCLECQSVVRRRGGDHRQVHYYHLSSISCHLSGKSMVHLQVQSRILELLPPGEGQMEYRFPTINRIADVVWLPQKLVFEIQCSAITAEEVQARNADYKRQGFHVVWILHDNRYNQRRVTAAEKFLGLEDSVPHYFTNIDQDGLGFIYDQFSLVRKGMRHVKLDPLPVEMAQPTWLPERFADVADVIDVVDKKKEIMSWKLSLERIFPKAVVKFGQCRKLHFFGDLLEQSLRSPVCFAFADYLDKAFEYEKEYDSNECDQILQQSLVVKVKYVKYWFSLWVTRPFSLLFQMILERACK
jgi:competence protein CoiA